MLVVHIGLGKTATTTLQKHIYPELSRIKNLSYNDPELVFHIRRCFLFGEQNGVFYEDLYETINKIDADIFISLESLVGWNPRHWEAAADINLKMFGEDANVIITVRDTVSYLTSLYQQRVHQGNIKNPDEYFVNSDIYSVLESKLGVNDLQFFDLDSYDLSKLHNIYISRFHNVTFVSVDQISSMQFLANIYSLSEEEKSVLVKLFKLSPRENRSFSDRAMRLTLKREALLNILGIKSLGTDDISQLSLYRFYINSNNFTQKPPVSNLNLNLNSFICTSKFKAYSVKMFSVMWRKFIQNVFDKVVPYSKYSLPKNIVFKSDLLKKNRDFINLLSK